MKSWHGSSILLVPQPIVIMNNELHAADFLMKWQIVDLIAMALSKIVVTAATTLTVEVSTPTRRTLSMTLGS
jgi:hypothetical protein